MKFLKCSSLVALSFIFMWAFVPHLSAKHKCRTSVGFSLNFDTRPRVYNYVAPAPVPVAAPMPVPVYAAPAPLVRPYPYYAPQPVYYPYAQRVYVQPQYTYWGY